MNAIKIYVIIQYKSYSIGKFKWQYSWSIEYDELLVFIIDLRSKEREMFNEWNDIHREKHSFPLHVQGSYHLSLIHITGIYSMYRIPLLFFSSKSRSMNEWINKDLLYVHNSYWEFAINKTR